MSKSLFAALAVLTVFTVGCNKNSNINQILVNPLGPSEVVASITGISISPVSITIERDPDDGCFASVALSASVSGTGDYSRIVVWSSSGGTINEGRFRVGKSGSYVVTATAANGMVVSAAITVVNHRCGGGDNPPPDPGPDPDPDPDPGPGPNPPPPPPPPTVTLSFTGNPLAIKKGQSSTLTWSSNVSCGASGGWSGHKGASGSESVAPTATTEYVLNCGGVSGKVKITVTEDQPPPPPPPAEKPVVNFSASPGSIEKGQNSVLSWTTQYATSCSASGAWGGSKSSSGSQSVSPMSTSSYTLSCTGSGGTTAKTVTISVTNPPPPPPPPPAKLTLSFTPAGGSIALGAMPTLTPICKMGAEVVSCPSDLWWSSTVPNTVAVVPEDRTYSNDPVWGMGFRKGGTIAARKVGQATICVEKKFDEEVAPFCAMFHVQ